MELFVFQICQSLIIIVIEKKIKKGFDKILANWSIYLSNQLRFLGEESIYSQLQFQLCNYSKTQLQFFAHGIVTGKIHFTWGICTCISLHFFR